MSLVRAGARAHTAAAVGQPLYRPHFEQGMDQIANGLFLSAFF